MPKRKKRRNDAPAVALPTNPEFEQFAEFTRKLLQVPKDEIDRRVAEEKDRRTAKN